MAEKRLFHPPDNSEMDAFALEHGKAIWLENTAFGFHILVSTEEEMRDAQRQVGESKAISTSPISVRNGSHNPKALRSRERL